MKAAEVSLLKFCCIQVESARDGRLGSLEAHLGAAFLWLLWLLTASNVPLLITASFQPLPPSLDGLLSCVSVSSWKILLPVSLFLLGEQSYQINVSYKYYATKGDLLHRCQRREFQLCLFVYLFILQGRVLSVRVGENKVALIFTPTSTNNMLLLFSSNFRME